MGAGASSKLPPGGVPKEVDKAPDLDLVEGDDPASDALSGSNAAVDSSTPFLPTNEIIHTPRSAGEPNTPREINISPRYRTPHRDSSQGGPSLTLEPPAVSSSTEKSLIHNSPLSSPDGTRRRSEEPRGFGMYEEPLPGVSTLTAMDSNMKLDEKVDDYAKNNSGGNTALPETNMTPPGGASAKSGRSDKVVGGDLDAGIAPSNKAAAPVFKASIHKRKKKKPKTAVNSTFPFATSNIDLHAGGKFSEGKNSLAGGDGMEGSEAFEEEKEEEVEEFIILDLPKDDIPHPTVPLGPPTEAVKDSFASKRFVEGLEGLKQRWGEVQFLLRIPIDKTENFNLVHQTSHQSILFLEEIESIAKEYGVLQGALSQWLMPFDSNTSASDQTNIYRLRTGKYDVFGAQLTEISEEKRVEMIKKMIDVRKLVKVKIADDNDLDLARRTVIDIDAFCRLLATEAEKRGEEIGPYEILNTELNA